MASEIIDLKGTLITYKFLSESVKKNVETIENLTVISFEFFGFEAFSSVCKFSPPQIPLTASDFDSMCSS